LILKPSEEDLKIWNHRYSLPCLTLIPSFIFKIVVHLYYVSFRFLILHAYLFECSFEYRLRVALGPGGDLMLTSRIRNTNSDGKPFSFTFAYHTYLSVSDIR
jgi:hypothetical protein